MPMEFDNHDWGKFLGRQRIEGDAARFQAAIAGKTVLLTGAGGSIGSALAMRIAACHPRLVLLLENSEQNLYQIHTDLDDLADGAPHIAILGDIADRPLLDAIFAQYHPEIVFHAAAFKHVPLMEANPLAAIRNNALGTYALARAMAHHSAEKLIMISTDKAVDPQSVMGASKRVAELVLMALSSEKTQMNSVRLGNVLGSRGSVGLLFLQQIRRGGPVTVTHPEVRRYFLTLSEAVNVVLTAASMGSCGGICVPELGPPLRILDLANYLIHHAGLRPGGDIPISFIGLRAGDKMMEQLVSTRETREAQTTCGLYQVIGPRLPLDDLESAVAELAECLRRRDLAALIQALRRIVPEYQPSAALRELATDTEIKANHV
ncbi:MAG: polysaccharide biosynthesis protein [Terriglobia bacterium]